MRILNLGLRWNISNGKNACIWGDKWIPSVSDFMVHSPEHQTSGLYKVSALMDPENRAWNIQLLNSLFSREEVNQILKIPIGDPSIEDQLIWHHTVHEKYSVKSGYQMLIDNQQVLKECASSDDPKIETNFWRNIWNLNTLPRIKNFLWRAAHNALPTLENLEKRHRSYHSGCTRCGGMESLEHVMFFCPTAQMVWKLSPYCYSPNEMGFNGFDKWWNEMYNMFEESGNLDAIPQIALICNSIWKARNELIFENVNHDPITIWRRACSENIPIRENIERTELVVPKHQWKPPDEGFVKVNVDASFDRSLSMAGVAAIARDNLGHVLDGAFLIIRSTSVRVSEAEALRFGVSLIKKNQWSNGCLESDNKSLVNSITTGNLVNGGTSSIELDVRKFLSFSNFKLCYCNRLANKTADWLAKNDRLRYCPMNWLDVMPANLRAILLQDVSVLNI